MGCILLAQVQITAMMDREGTTHLRDQLLPSVLSPDAAHTECDDTSLQDRGRACKEETEASPGWRGIVWRSGLIITAYVAVTELVYGYGLERWGAARALYFAAIVATGGGTGQVAPMTQRGRLFTIFYVPVTICIVGVAVTEVVKAIRARHDAREQNMRERLMAKLHVPSDTIVEGGITSRAIPKPRSPAGESLALVGEIAKAVVPVVVVNLVGVTTIATLEKWSAIDALYYAVVISLTQGYGDVYPTRTLTYVIGTLYVVCAVICVGGGVSYVVDYKLQRRAELRGYELLHRPNACDALFFGKPEADATVSEPEYCLHMLKHWDMVDPKVIASVKKRFRDLDVNHNERLTREEFARDAEVLEAGTQRQTYSDIC